MKTQTFSGGEVDFNEKCAARGSKLGRPKFVMSEPQRGMVAAYAAGEGGLVTLANLAEVLNCSIGKAHALVKEPR